MGNLVREKRKYIDSISLYIIHTRYIYTRRLTINPIGVISQVRVIAVIVNFEDPFVTWFTYKYICILL